eukprot:TRINITY_DN12781_c0_g3_i1.p1 TRINITY_DN12781_c0_g3~~TRINITY_DN12781_c0_g3_i1.p1  ORF type:complete len:699 (+),score=92.20 TRINITY_DN12781_c0_g3_i1:139-2235(+)
MGCGSSVTRIDSRECLACDYDDLRVIIDSSTGELLQVNEYEVVKRVGSGRRGTVYHVVKNGYDYAIKELNKKAGYKREINILVSYQQHPNVIDLFEVLKHDGYSKIYLVMEYMSGGELCRVSPSGYLLDNIFTEDQARRVFTQICSAVIHLHGEDIVHRDIKPENILWTDESRTKIKLCDFGSALILKTDDDITKNTRNSTQLFLPPESSSGRKFSSKEADSWAVGVILHLVLVGRYPWGLNNPTQFQFFEEMQSPLNLNLQDTLSDDCRQILRQKLSFDVLRRMPLEELAGSAWLNGSDLPFGMTIACSDSESIASSEADYYVTTKDNSSIGNTRVRKGCPSVFHPRDGETQEKFHILLCEPHFRPCKTLLSQICRIVESGNMSIEVIIQRDIESVLKTIQTTDVKYHLVVIPVYGRRMSGYEACARLRAAKFDTPIVGITSQGDKFTDLCMQFGMDHVLSKPTQGKTVYDLLKWAGYPIENPPYFDDFIPGDYDDSSYYEYCHKLESTQSSATFRTLTSEFDNFTFRIGSTEYNSEAELGSKWKRSSSDFESIPSSCRSNKTARSQFHARRSTSVSNLGTSVFDSENGSVDMYSNRLKRMPTADFESTLDSCRSNRTSSSHFHFVRRATLDEVTNSIDENPLSPMSRVNTEDDPFPFTSINQLSDVGEGQKRCDAVRVPRRHSRARRSLPPIAVHI